MSPTHSFTFVALHGGTTAPVSLTHQVHAIGCNKLYHNRRPSKCMPSVVIFFVWCFDDEIVSIKLLRFRSLILPTKSLSEDSIV